MAAVRAICIGSAACVHDDLAAAAAIGIEPGDQWTVIAVNRMGIRWPGALPNWASFHAEIMPRWVLERRALGLPDAGRIWTGARRVAPSSLEIKRVVNWGGSSGLLSVTVALELGAEKIVLCGIPIDHEQGHFDSPAKKWRDATNYHRAWLQQYRALVNVRSMSGWTAEKLGRPDEEWLVAPPATVEYRDEDLSPMERRRRGMR